jgi:hypothetical protein
MLSLGVIIVSRSQSFAVDLTGFLFGDVLAVREQDLLLLGGALLLALAVSVLGHRAFLALAFDARKAQTLGLRPRPAHAVLLGLLALAIVASFHIVGTLLVLGLLIAPPAAALPWARSVRGVMALAALLGIIATFGGLLLSWHLSTAAGAPISALAVSLFFLSHLASGLRHRSRARLPGPGSRVRSDAAVTTVTDEEGRTRIYRRAGLEKGKVGSARTLPGTHTGAVVPYAEHLLGVTDNGKVAVYDRQGERAASPDARCEEVRSDAVTRRGVVLGCADGALLVREDDGTFTAEKIPYGSDVSEAERATAFQHRPGSDTLTAPAGKRAVWVLDVGERTWTRVKTGSVVSANTAGEGSVLIVLETDGALHGYDIATGKQVSRTKRLLTGAPDAGREGSNAGPVIEVDRSRAYHELSGVVAGH